MAAISTFQENLEKVTTYRADIAQGGLKHIINGRHVTAVSGQTYENGSPICTVAEGAAADIDAAAQAAGCTVVHKPAELSPVTAQRLTEIIHDAGIAPGVVNLVNGYGETAGQAARNSYTAKMDWANGGLIDRYRLNPKTRSPVGPGLPPAGSMVMPKAA